MMLHLVHTSIGHRYGWRPHPTTIEKSEFEQIRNCIREEASADPDQKNSEDQLQYLDSNYWKLDESSTPHVFILQAISTLPGVVEWVTNNFW